MSGETLAFILLAFNLLIALVMALGGAVMRGLRNDVDKLRETDSKLAADIRASDQRLATELKNCVQKDDFKEFRDEQRSNFRELFEKIDNFHEKLAGKADRGGHR